VAVKVSDFRARADVRFVEASPMLRLQIFESGDEPLARCANLVIQTRLAALIADAESHRFRESIPNECPYYFKSCRIRVRRIALVSRVSFSILRSLPSSVFATESPSVSFLFSFFLDKTIHRPANTRPSLAEQQTTTLEYETPFFYSAACTSTPVRPPRALYISSLFLPFHVPLCPSRPYNPLAALLEIDSARWTSSSIDPR